MQLERARRLARLAGGYLSYLRTPLDEASARDRLRERLAEREERFLGCARELIYAWPESPLRALLLWAGCGQGELERAVRRDRLERTLAALRDAGVYLTLDEVKGRRPIRRPGLELHVTQASFDNPLLGGGLVGKTSGSRGSTSRVLYGWDFFAEEAANEALLYAAHDASELPGAFWLPGPPSISGMHNLLVELKFRRAPERWFSHLAPPATEAAGLAFLRLGARAQGLRVPRIEPTGSADATRVARWLARARDQRGGAVLKAFATSAVRVAAAARESGLDLGGCVVLAGGEALSPRRTAFVRASGARVHARYVTTETGLVAGSCRHAGDDAPDRMHVYADRLAVIPSADGTHAADGVAPLLFTTLSPASGKVLLNADLGDAGRLERRTCGCPFGELGLELTVSGVRSDDKLTFEGVTIAHAILDDAIGAVVEELGGAPDAYQLVDQRDERGLGRLVVKLSPSVGAFRADHVAERILAELARRDPAGAIAARLWRDADVLQIVAADPELAPSAKLPRVVRQVAR
ncbi:MAG TPA: hypothetical protein VIS07_22120 [Candidatus Binatia bacterium]